MRSAPNCATTRWTAAADNVGVVGYHVYHDGQLRAQTDAATLTGTCGNLNPKTNYRFYVNARDAAGNVSQPSPTLPITTPGASDTMPPSAPTGVHTTSVSATSIALAWNTSTDNTTLSALTANTAYHLQGTAVDANKNEGAASTPVLDVTTPGGGGTQPICTVIQVGTDDDVVWGLVTLPDGTILYNERDAQNNPEGLAFDARGRLWEQEFGNNVMDETNLIVKGGNYGWPACEGTTGTCNTAGFIAPKQTYPVENGLCAGITVISGDSLTNVQQFFVGTYGRVRTVEPAPDSGMWMATSNGGDKDSTPHNSNNQIFHVALG